jgi:hypothetical protein
MRLKEPSGAIRKMSEYITEMGASIPARKTQFNPPGLTVVAATGILMNTGYRTESENEVPDVSGLGLWQQVGSDLPAQRRRYLSSTPRGAFSMLSIAPRMKQACDEVALE